jgi:WD40 repeat protein
VRLRDPQTERPLPSQTGEDFLRPDFLDGFAAAIHWLAGQMSRLLDTQTWKTKQTLDAKSAGEDLQRSVSRFLLSVNRVTALAFFPDGKILSGEIEGRGFKRWDTRTGEVKEHAEDKDGGSSLAAISPNGATLIETGADATQSVRNSADEKWNLITGSGGESISALALSSVGHLIAVASGKDLILRNAKSGEKGLTLSGHQTTITCLVFSNDDRTLASADEGGTINLWDLTTGQRRNTLKAGGKVTALSFAPNGQLLASAGDDRTISLWDLQTGSLRVKLKKHDR